MLEKKNREGGGNSLLPIQTPGLHGRTRNIFQINRAQRKSGNGGWESQELGLILHKITRLQLLFKHVFHPHHQLAACLVQFLGFLFHLCRRF